MNEWNKKWKVRERRQDKAKENEKWEVRENGKYKKNKEGFVYI
jgi:hypothetical protein